MEEFDEEGNRTGPKAAAKPGARIYFTEWDCPSCDANNPYDDGFKGGDELMCCYCGLRFRVLRATDEKFKLVPI
ncbi:MAG: hypothetical protein WC889_09845 [Myxococcota bacterium]|jgi:hypothetical protein